MALPNYNRMVREALTNQHDRFYFAFFRGYYSETPQYDPLAEQILKKIQDYAYVIKNDSDPYKRKEAQKKYTNLLLKHLANIDIVTQAYLLSKDDIRFGEHKFFSWLRRGLLESIKKSGNGKSLMHAYDVITLGEETALLSALGIKVLKTIPAEQAQVYYNMHDVKDLRSGREYSIFVNITKPMLYLEDERYIKEKTFILQR